jgi:ATP-dependent Clp protease ATP-binding subunit ClpC
MGRMLKRLDEQARTIVQLANEIAHEFELEYVGTEHILLAILRHADNPGARALTRLGVDEEKVREQLDELYQRSKEDTWVFGRLPGSPHYRNVIERAVELADQLETAQIGSAHLLLALYHDKESTAQQTLATLGVPLKKCREAVLRELNGAK